MGLSLNKTLSYSSFKELVGNQDLFLQQKITRFLSFILFLLIGFLNLNLKLIHTRLERNNNVYYTSPKTLSGNIQMQKIQILIYRLDINEISQMFLYPKYLSTPMGFLWSPHILYAKTKRKRGVQM